MPTRKIKYSAYGKCRLTIWKKQIKYPTLPTNSPIYYTDLPKSEEVRYVYYS